MIVYLVWEKHLHEDKELRTVTLSKKTATDDFTECESKNKDKKYTSFEIEEWDAGEPDCPT